MAAAPIRLLVASVALLLGLALAPVAGVEAAHADAARAVASTRTDVAALTERERVLDADARLVTDDGPRTGAAIAAPPTWLLLLLAPILLGGGIATGLTLRRLR